MQSTTNSSSTSGQVWLSSGHLMMNIAGTVYQIDQQGQSIGYLQESGTPTPTFTAGSGAGTSPTISISGGISGGTISIKPGVGSVGSAVVVTVTYGVTFPTGSSVVLYPANLSAAQLNGLGGIYTSGTTTNFTINATTTAMTAGTTFVYNYMAIGW